MLIIDVKKGMMRKKLIKKLYSFIWRRWLWNEFYQNYDIVLKVLGWRTARVCSRFYTDVRITSPCFTLFWIRFF